MQEQYFENLTRGNSENAKMLLSCAEQIKEKSESVYKHNLSVLYSSKAPVEVALMAFDMTIVQLMNNDAPNPMVILQSLSNNKRSDPVSVFECYQRIMQRRYVSAGIKHMYDYICKMMAYATEQDTNKRTANYFKNQTDNGIWIVNPVRIPKQGWLMHIYASSVEDYCRIVQETLGELKSLKITVFLHSPEKFERDIEKEEYAIAYSIFINDNFSLTKMSESLICMLDDGNIPEISSQIQLSNRAYAELVLFDAEKYCGTDGNVYNNVDQIKENYTNPDALLEAFEDIGTNTNVVKYYIEIMTGIPMQNVEQFYSAVVYNAEQEREIFAVLDEYDTFNINFIVESNIPQKKILFLHKSNAEKILKIFNEKKIIVKTNAGLS